jgi:large subunit ribosomal protein L10
VDRAAKRELVEGLHTVFKNTGVVVVSHYAGLTVAQMTDYRRRMKEAGGSVKVAKNRLAKLALKDTDAAGIANLFEGQTCVAFSKDPIAAAKVTVAYAKTNDKMVILGGSMGKTVLTPDSVKALASLPSLDELRAKLIGLLNAPAVKEPGAKLARVIQAKASKSEAA